MTVSQCLYKGKTSMHLSCNYFAYFKIKPGNQDKYCGAHKAKGPFMHVDKEHVRNFGINRGISYLVGS